MMKKLICSIEYLQFHAGNSSFQMINVNNILYLVVPKYNLNVRLTLYWWCFVNA